MAEKVHRAVKSEI